MNYVVKFTLGLLVLGTLATPALAQKRAVADTGRTRGPYSVVLSVGGGLSYYSTHLGVPATLSNTQLSRFGVPLTVRALWVPDHRLRLGLESGWTTMYSYRGRVNNTEGRVYVSAIPTLAIFQMPLAWLSGNERSIARRLSVTGGTGVYIVHSRLDYESIVQTSTISLGWMAAASYTQPLGPRFRVSGELKWYDAVASQNAAFAAQLQLNYRLIRW
ncbi:hypothetical protein CLV58_11235 [Spirosoma oryzae]|uniref:Outer membrane protein with beta-barrel domain n=1 Tax=Spirosoma oryzae TaxID=1469603 RepID=A0A2T0SSQ4_9BACT|nr:hypothetical protein [Spirosoma oryzae]PRY36445.1 hypothetical protein CLV58_11235 [Spirosoma oryzae]